MSMLRTCDHPLRSKVDDANIVTLSDECITIIKLMKFRCFALKAFQCTQSMSYLNSIWKSYKTLECYCLEYYEPKPTHELDVYVVDIHYFNMCLLCKISWC